MDEVMAALRVVSLAEDEAHERIVVDTAPTGHTLRLLEAGKLLEGWTRAVEAMAAKGSAVALGLTGRTIRFAGESTMATMRNDIDRFAALLSEADFVVVTRDGVVVEAETRRLIERLRGDELRVAATVEVGSPDGEGSDDAQRPAADHAMPADRTIPTFRVASRDDLDGCDGLREWGVTTPPRSSRRAAARGPRVAGGAERGNVLTLLPPRPVMLFSGKGGVGKSTCAAAYAVSLTRERRVLLLSTDPAGSLGEVLDGCVGPEGTSFGPRLVARQLAAEADFARFRAAHQERIREVFERLGLQHSVALDRRVLESLVDVAPPGLDEVFAVDAILDGSDEQDVLLIDTAPTGHFLRLLEMPEIALSWTRALMRILVKYRAVLGLDDLAHDVLRFAKRLKGLVALLGDREQSGVVIVTLSDALAGQETERLTATLRTRGVSVSAVIQNRWSPDDPVVTARPPLPIILSPLVSPPPVGSEALLGLAGQWCAA
jgi:arsenite-transporting ATPase